MGGRGAIAGGEIDVLDRPVMDQTVHPQLGHHLLQQTQQLLYFVLCSTLLKLAMLHLALPAWSWDLLHPESAPSLWYSSAQ